MRLSRTSPARASAPRVAADSSTGPTTDRSTRLVDASKRRCTASSTASTRTRVRDGLVRFPAKPTIDLRVIAVPPFIQGLGFDPEVFNEAPPSIDSALASVQTRKSLSL